MKGFVVIGINTLLLNIYEIMLIMKKKHIIGLATLGVLAITTYIILLYENRAYDPYEVAQINSFLSQQSNIESKTNGEELGCSPKWPLFWGEVWLNKERRSV